MSKRKESQKPVIAVTGGGEGIGRAILLYFAERGYDVAILDRNPKTLQQTAADCKELGADALALVCDVSIRDDVTKAYEQISKHYGRIDIQVNNAGIFIRERIEDFTDEVTDALINVNLRGVLNTSQAAIKIMKHQGSGSIINAHSLLGTYPDFGLGVYSATKAAVAIFTRVLAAECAPYGIRVNAYAPMTTDTAMVRHVIEERADAKLDQISMREFGEPMQIAKICWFLATDMSAYTSGASIPSDGGHWAVQRPFKAWEAAGKLDSSEKR
jgi:3-oxoacyl-[acyl-carrier protein] reductase